MRTRVQTLVLPKRKREREEERVTEGGEYGQSTSYACMESQ
jgi:hypothetical protein